jgi:hypothetical protein
MGVTIHFEGKLTERPGVDEVVAEAERYAESVGWPFQRFEKTNTTLRRVRDEQDWDYTGPTRGVTLQPHPDSDPFSLEFDRDLYVQEYVKTQFAGPETHIAIISLLRRIQPLFESLDVNDEGEFWNTNDRLVLESNINWCAAQIDRIKQETPSARGPVRLENGRIADVIS